MVERSALLQAKQLNNKKQTIIFWMSAQMAHISAFPLNPHF